MDGRGASASRRSRSGLRAALHGLSVETAIPLGFDAYATFYTPDVVAEATHERAAVDVLVRHTAEQARWLGYLDTGAHDVVFPLARRVSLYSDWLYVLVEAGPSEALRWRTGHMRGGVEGSLPELIFPHDLSRLVSALWDDTWAYVGGSHELIDALVQEPLANARAVQPHEEALTPGLTRDGGG